MELWKIECSQHTHCTLHTETHKYRRAHTHTHTRDFDTDTKVMRLDARSIENNILYSCSHHYQLRDIRTHALAIISTQLKYYLPIPQATEYKYIERLNAYTDKRCDRPIIINIIFIIHSPLPSTYNQKCFADTVRSLRSTNLRCISMYVPVNPVIHTRLTDRRPLL